MCRGRSRTSTVLSEIEVRASETAAEASFGETRQNVGRGNAGQAAGTAQGRLR